MVEQAATPARGSNRPVQTVEPLPALPTEPQHLAVIVDRVLDLAHSARRVHLRDVDEVSRTRPSRPELAAIFEAQRNLTERDPLDLAGLTFIKDALQFLQDMGQREPDAFAARHEHDDRHFTYWHMDLVPEHRLAI
jgi:hypothetical protein